MNLFYAPEIRGKSYYLPEDESKHVVKVLRLVAGDSISLTDGKGGWYTAKIIGNNPRRCELEIIEEVTDFGKRDYKLSIAIAPTKSIDRFEWFLEKCTEIGIDSIYPVICARSERKIIKPERLNRVITAAMKQSLKAYHPVLHQQMSFQDIINLDFTGQKFIAYCGDGKRDLLQRMAVAQNEILILIGPEGDFTPDETDLAESSGFKGISLGDSRLRTETAGIAACHTIALINQK